MLNAGVGTTFTAGLRANGTAAPRVLDEPMNLEAFLVYFDKVFCPT